MVKIKDEKEKVDEVPLEQIIKDREVSIEKTEDSIKWIGEEINYKENQIDNEIIEENISQLYNLVSFPKDKKKPKHVLKIEIEMLKKAKKRKERSLKIMKEIQIKDEDDASKSG